MLFPHSKWKISLQFLDNPFQGWQIVVVVFLILVFVFLLCFFSSLCPLLSSLFWELRVLIAALWFRMELQKACQVQIKMQSEYWTAEHMLCVCVCVCLCIRPVWRGGIALFPLSLCQLKGFPSVVTEMRGWCQHVLYCYLVQMLPIMIIFCSLHVQISSSSTA